MGNLVASPSQKAFNVTSKRNHLDYMPKVAVVVYICGLNLIDAAFDFTTTTCATDRSLGLHTTLFIVSLVVAILLEVGVGSSARTVFLKQRTRGRIFVFGVLWTLATLVWLLTIETQPVACWALRVLPQYGVAYDVDNHRAVNGFVLLFVTLIVAVLSLKGSGKRLRVLEPVYSAEERRGNKVPRVVPTRRDHKNHLDFVPKVALIVFIGLTNLLSGITKVDLNVCGATGVVLYNVIVAGCAIIAFAAEFIVGSSAQKLLCGVRQCNYAFYISLWIMSVGAWLLCILPQPTACWMLSSTGSYSVFAGQLVRGLVLVGVNILVVVLAPLSCSGKRRCYQLQCSSGEREPGILDADLASYKIGDAKNRVVVRLIGIAKPERVFLTLTRHPENAGLLLKSSSSYPVGDVAVEYGTVVHEPISRMVLVLAADFDGFGAEATPGDEVSVELSLPDGSQFAYVLPNRLAASDDSADQKKE